MDIEINSKRTLVVVQQIRFNFILKWLASLWCHVQIMKKFSFKHLDSEDFGLLVPPSGRHTQETTLMLTFLMLGIALKQWRDTRG